MNKANIVRSSEFFMAEGDVLHYILIVDSGATPTIDLVSVGTIDNSNDVPDAVVALDASDITSSSFTANWNFIENSNGYYLDVATDSAFTALVIDNLSVGYVNERAVGGLDDATPYYYRVRAVNDNGTGESSNTITTTTAITPGVTDADGNVYTYVTIGTQQWMVESFRSTKYNDGTAITNVTVDADWIAEDGTVGRDGGYVWYDNDIANKSTYGALYNWYAVNNAHGLAPTGWRVPSETDWNTLAAFVGGYAVMGGELKEAGIAHWTTPNTGAVDTYGFTGLPVGRRSAAAAFAKLYEEGYMWSSTAVDATNAKYVDMYYNAIDMSITGNDKRLGFAVRMMRDVI